MHNDCVYQRLRTALAALALWTAMVPSSGAGEMWYARAVRGFDLPAALPDLVPIALEPERFEAHPSESCTPPAQYLIWTLQVDESDVDIAMRPISLYRPAPLRATRLIHNRLDAVAMER